MGLALGRTPWLRTTPQAVVVRRSVQMNELSAALFMTSVEDRLRRLEAGQAALLGVTMRLLARSFQETGISKAIWNEVIERTALASEELQRRPGLPDNERRKMVEVARIIRTFTRTTDAPKRENMQ